MKRTIVAMAILLTVVAGCQKENNANKSVPIAKAYAINPSAQKASEGQSGNGTVGINHNRALHSLIAYSRNNGGINRDELFIFLDQYYAAPQNVNRADNHGFAKRLMNRQPINIEEILSLLPYSETAKQLFRSIMNVVLELKTLDIQLLNDRLVLLENKARQPLKDQELTIVLQLGSVARHSALFWKTYYGDHLVPTGEGLLKMLAIIHADNCGLVVGVIMGDPEFWAAYFSATVGFAINSDKRVDI